MATVNGAGLILTTLITRVVTANGTGPLNYLAIFQLHIVSIMSAPYAQPKQKRKRLGKPSILHHGTLSRKGNMKLLTRALVSVKP